MWLIPYLIWLRLIGSQEQGVHYIIWLRLSGSFPTSSALHRKGVHDTVFNLTMGKVGAGKAIAKMLGWFGAGPDKAYPHQAGFGPVSDECHRIFTWPCHVGCTLHVTMSCQMHSHVGCTVMLSDAQCPLRSLDRN